MRMPRGQVAIVDLEKLTGYCLDPEHPRGKHKARVFAASLGLTALNAEKLRAALLEAAATREAQPGMADEFGVRYVVDFQMQGPQGTATVTSSWIIRRRGMGACTSRGVLARILDIRAAAAGLDSRIVCLDIDLVPIGRAA